MQLYQGCTISSLITFPALSSHFPSITPLTSSPPILGSFAPNCLNTSGPWPPNPVASNPGLTVHTLTPSFFNTLAKSRINIFSPVLTVRYVVNGRLSACLGHPFSGLVLIRAKDGSRRPIFLFRFPEGTCLARHEHQPRLRAVPLRSSGTARVVSTRVPGRLPMQTDTSARLYEVRSRSFNHRSSFVNKQLSPN